jgi:hypothetical protein
MSVFATKVPIFTFDAMRTLFAFMLLPALSSLILERMKGVFSFPDMRVALACQMASCTYRSFSDIEIAASVGIGFASRSPDDICI